MPKIRALHPGIWTDVTLGECSRDARLFYMGLWTVADDAGVFEWHEKLLKSQIFPFDDNLNVGKLLTELEHKNRVVSFIHSGKKYGLVQNFTKYQKPDSRYIKYLIGDIEHVKTLLHAEHSPCARRDHGTEGEGVIEGDTTTSVVGAEHDKPKEFGNKYVNRMIAKLQQVTGLPYLNGTQQENRRFAHTLHRKYTKAVRDLNPGMSEEECMEKAADLLDYTCEKIPTDTFWAGKVNSMHTLLKHSISIHNPF